MDDYAFEHYHYDYESGMEKLKKEFGPINRHGVSAWLDNMGHPNLAKMVMDEKRFPSIQPKKGKWDFVGDDMFKCLSCGELYTAKQLSGLRNYLTDPYLPLFCPHCGSYNGGVIGG